MKLVTINNALLLKYTGDSEVLQKSTRPYVLVVRLKYKDTVNSLDVGRTAVRFDFAANPADRGC